MKHSLTIRQYAKFMVVGIGNTLLSIAVYAILIHAGTYYPAAGAAAFLAGATQGYLLNRYWTFSMPGFSLATFWRYVAVQMAALGVSTGLLIVAVEIVNADKLIAQIALLPFVSAASFVISRRWALVPVREPSEQGCAT